MYRRNERAFEHDVTRFMLRNGLKMGKVPCWQNQRVSLFQLFLAVHEQGGYQQVGCILFRSFPALSLLTHPMYFQRGLVKYCEL
jgi:hypothetical protein